MAVTFIQSNATNSTTTAALASTLNGVAAGNLLVAIFAINGPAGTISEVNISDNNGNVWTVAASIFNTAQFNNTYAIAYATGVHAGNTTVTLSVASATGMTLQLAEFNSGIAGRNLGVDQIATAVGTGTALNSGTVTTLHNNEALVGLVAGASNPVTAGAGFTVFGGSNPLGEYQTVSSTGTYAAAGTTVSSGPWTAILVTFFISPFPVFTKRVGRFDSLGQFVGALLASTWENINITPVTVSANTTGDQNLMAVTIPANTLNSIGRTLKVYAKAVYSTPVASTATVEVKINLGSVTLLDFVTTANVGSITNNTIIIEGTISTQTAGASASFESSGKLTIDLGATPATACSIFADTNTATLGPIDTTVDETLQITIAFSAASASNSATMRQLVANTIN